MLAAHPTITSGPEMESRNASEKLQGLMVKQGNMNLIFKNIFVFRYMVEMFCLTVADPRIQIQFTRFLKLVSPTLLQRHQEK